VFCEKFNCNFAARVICSSPADLTGKRHEAEFDCLKRLDHPNSIRLCDHFRMNGCHVMILQYFQGGTRLKEIQASGKTGIAPGRFVPITRQLLDAVAYCHAIMILHRDIRPGNIFIDEYDRRKLTDF
jgi:serine/threonine-protein kinase